MCKALGSDGISISGDRAAAIKENQCVYTAATSRKGFQYEADELNMIYEIPDAFAQSHVFIKLGSKRCSRTWRLHHANRITVALPACRGFFAASAVWSARCVLPSDMQIMAFTFYSLNSFCTRFMTLSFSALYGWSLLGISSTAGNAAL
jgi:hypothetical protein